MYSFCGKARNVKYPHPVTLNSETLPWVQSAEHLDHMLDQSTSMEKDCNSDRARYVSKSLELRN